MPLQNRVAPDGQLIAAAARGLMMGNRGRLHHGQRIVRSSASRTWLICLLQFKGRHREVMSPQSYTELFFLDEAVALAAGHRPCAECRRGRYREYRDAVGAGSAKDLDAMLAASRRAPRETADVATLPDGAFVRLGDNDFRLIWNRRILRWSPEGYSDAPATRTYEVLTPALSLQALRNGYRPEVVA